MKKTLFAILLCGFMVMGLTGCIKENNDDDKKSYENNDECCESCMCGDTIELLKTTETVWILTKIDNEGEYKYIKDSFINFHGTGKNKFAFFNNDKKIKRKSNQKKKNQIKMIIQIITIKIIQMKTIM